MIVVSQETRDPACEDFVKASPEGTVCHSWEWSEMVARVFGHRCFYLVARNADRVCGVLPLTYIRSRLFGNQLVSQAFGNYGGPLYDSQPALDALYERALEIARDVGAETVEFRNVTPLPYNLRLRMDKVCMRLPLASNPDDLWNGFKSDTKVRNHIRKAEKAGIVTTVGRHDLLDEFFDVYALRMHQLGTPCYSRAFMRGILEAFPDESLVFVARLQGQTVAARLVVSYNGIVESNFGVTRIDFNNVSPNHGLYWAVMKHYCLAGAVWFDFGRSTVDSGPYLFKKQWGAVPVKLHYQYWTRPGREARILSPDDPRYRRRIEMWKRLPHCVTRWLGPRISASLP